MASCTFSDYISKLYEHDELVRNYWHYVQNFFPGYYMLSGSMAEGACICRLVGPSKRLEVDKMVPFNATEGDITLMPTEHVGFYNVSYNDKLLLNFAQQNIEFPSMVYECFSKGSSPSIASIVKAEIHNKYITQYREAAKEFGLIPKLNSDEVFSLISSYTSPDMDDVSCIHLKEWPHLAFSSFKGRRRYWPEKEVLTKIKSLGCHLVPKYFNSIYDWRISFSQAEIILSKEQNSFQRKCYLLAKLIFYAGIKQFKDKKSGKKMSSYLLKTVMLFMLEETRPEKWELFEDGNCFLDVVCELFKRLSHAFKTQKLLCFFLQEMNLLEGYSDQFLIEMENQMDKISKLWIDGKNTAQNLESIEDLYFKVVPKDPSDYEVIKKMHSSEFSNVLRGSLLKNFVIGCVRVMTLLFIYTLYVIFHFIKDSIKCNLNDSVRRIKNGIGLPTMIRMTESSLPILLQLYCAYKIFWIRPIMVTLSLIPLLYLGCKNMFFERPVCFNLYRKRFLSYLKNNTRPSIFPIYTDQNLIFSSFCILPSMKDILVYNIKSIMPGLKRVILLVLHVSFGILSLFMLAQMVYYYFSEESNNNSWTIYGSMLLSCAYRFVPTE